MEARDDGLGVVVALPNDIIARARSYDHAALVELFDAGYDDAYGIAFALSGDPDVAAGAADDAFGRALDRIDDLPEDGAHATAWLAELARVAVRRRPRRVGGDQVRDGLGRLSEAEHQAVTLRILGGYELPAVAAATRRRRASVESSLLSGLRSLAGIPARLSGPTAARQVDAALVRVAAGDRPDEAAAVVPALPEARAVLAAAAAAGSRARAEPAPAIRARARVHFLAEADARRAQWVHRKRVTPGVPGRRAPRRRPFLSTMSLGLALLLAVVAGIALAVAAAIATPSSKVYGLKRVAEDTLVAITPDRVTRAALLVKLADQRREEAETEAASHHPDAAVVAYRGRYDAMLAAAHDLEAVPQHGKDWVDARNRLEKEANQSASALERILQANGGKAQAAQIAALESRFQSERKAFDKVLLPSQGTAHPAPAPSGATPSPTPPQ